MLPMVLEFLEEHGFEKTAAVFKEERKTESKLKLTDLFSEALKRKRGEAPANGAAKPAAAAAKPAAAATSSAAADDDDDDDECAHAPPSLLPAATCD